MSGCPRLHKYDTAAFDRTDLPLPEISVTSLSKMQIFVRGTDGRHVDIDVNSYEPIDSLKKKIQGKLGFRPDEQLITFQGRALINGTVTDYGIQAGCALTVSVAVVGG
jgi:hypothetical protein